MTDENKPQSGHETKKHEAPSAEKSLPELSPSDIEAAQKQGMSDAIAEGARTKFLQSGGQPGEEGDERVAIDFNVFQIQDLVDLDPKALKERLSKDNKAPSLTQGQVAGLLEVERSGKNRTDVVKVLCEHLKITSPYEVTNAGPAYTNDVTRTDVVTE